MKVFILLLAISGLALSMRPLLLNTNNNLDKCLVSVKSEFEGLTQTVSSGLQKSWLEMVKDIFQLGAHGISSYEACKEVTESDFTV